MREANRTLQLKLRDIEVANDDYERQARNTSSSLEDLESKYNVAIERGVMLEEEIRGGEQEREGLRIEAQRLRDELSDLRIEAEITQEKLRLAEATIERFHSRKPQPLANMSLRARSPTSEASRTTASSPTFSTPPPTKSEASTTSDAPTPPSPPLSDAPSKAQVPTKTPLPSKRRSFVPDANSTPRPGANGVGARLARHTRGPSFASSSNGMPPPRSRPSHMPSEGLPRSGSLYQIKGLIGRMQRIEERVHSVRSKLPPSDRATPRASPRTGSALDSHVPASVTLRSSRKRISTSEASSVKNADDVPAAGRSSRTSQHVKRLSFGVAPPATAVDRPASALSRPSSRASNASHSAANAANQYSSRPSSRSSMGGARTPLGHYPSHTTTAGAERRPRSSIAGSYSAVHGARHGHSMSMNETIETDVTWTTPSARRTTLDKSGIPTPSANKRMSGNFASSVHGGRRPSIPAVKQHEGPMAPPASDSRRKVNSGVGETF